MKKSLAIFLIFFCVIDKSFAATADVNAVVVENLAISQTTAMNFGSFSASGSSGTIDQAGNVTGGVTSVSGGATRSGSIFSVSGTGNSSYTFNLPSTATIGIGGSGGTNPMTATLAFASGNASRSLSSGSENVTVNGSLAVGANQASGTYSGTYTVTAHY